MVTETDSRDKLRLKTGMFWEKEHELQVFRVVCSRAYQTSQLPMANLTWQLNA